MITPNVMPKLSVGRIGRETSDKITRSFAECEENDLTLRQVLCPHCKSIVAEVFSDAVGHQLFKGKKCKSVTVDKYGKGEHRKTEYLKDKERGDRKNTYRTSLCQRFRHKQSRLVLNACGIKVGL